MPPADPTPMPEIDQATAQAAILTLAQNASQKAAAEPAEKLTINVTVPGGCYEVNGVLVNAWGDPIGTPMPDASKLPDADKLKVDPYAK